MSRRNGYGGSEYNAKYMHLCGAALAIASPTLKALRTGTRTTRYDTMVFIFQRNGVGQL